jgi:putative glutamine amidotransferase
MKPLIGITANYRCAEGSYSLKDYYVAALTEAGALPLILPSTGDDSLWEEFTNICDGFVLSGGGDMDPIFWGELPSSFNGDINPWRDRFEVVLARRAFRLHKPVLGICRGCQVMNVARGGSLLQDIASSMCHMQNAPRNYPFHDIFIESNSRLHKTIQNDIIRVNSFHHQAVNKLGSGLVISAMASDGTIEAIEDKRHRFFVGVQWHPECLQDEPSARLFAALAQKAKHS